MIVIKTLMLEFALFMGLKILALGIDFLVYKLVSLTFVFLFSYYYFTGGKSSRGRGSKRVLEVS